MAHSTTHTSYDIPILGAILRGFGALGNSLIMMSNSNARVREATALFQLSDAQLADRGLKREDIARKVFADCYWI